MHHLRSLERVEKQDKGESDDEWVEKTWKLSWSVRLGKLIVLKR